MPALFRRDPIRALRLLFLVFLVVAGVLGQIQAYAAGASGAARAITAVLVGCILVLRVLEFRTGQLVPFLVDPIELAAVGAVLLTLGQVQPVFGLIFTLLLFRAATGRLRRVLSMMAGYVALTVTASVVLGIDVTIDMYQGMVTVTVLVYGMRHLLLRLRDEQQRQSRMFAEVLGRLPFPVLVTGAHGDVLLANAAATALTGPLDEVQARTTDGTPVDLRRLTPGEHGLEVRLNEETQVVVETVPTEHGTIVALLDVTARRSYEERLQHAAYHDPLTGLPNRALLWERFAAVADGPYAVLLVDLDGFKSVNDTYGHQAGDELLCQVAARLRHACGTQATVARLGGDEFAVLLPGARTELATATAMAIRGVFDWPAPLSTGPVAVGGSIGYALGGPGRSLDEVFAGADAAMYADKHGRRTASIRW